MVKAELEKPEPVPQLTEPQPEKFAPALAGTRITRRYGDTEYEVYPNRDPRLDEIEDWQRR